MNKKLITASRELGELLLAKNLLLVTAESCTGGLLASSITCIAGSSQWFERGFVTYSNLAKQEMLGVKPDTLNRWGAVSEQVAREMAEGALIHSHAQISIAITGIAGPSGGSPNKPVGTVWFAWARLGGVIYNECKHYHGDRINIQQQATLDAMRYLLGSGVFLSRS